MPDARNNRPFWDVLMDDAAPSEYPPPMVDGQPSQTLDVEEHDAVLPAPILPSTVTDPVPVGWIASDVSVPRSSYPYRTVQLSEDPLLTLAQVHSRVEDLLAWANARELVLAAPSFGAVRIDSPFTYHVPIMFRITTRSVAEPYGWPVFREAPSSFVCPICDERHDPYHAVCQGVRLSCFVCGNSHAGSSADLVFTEDSVLLCAEHTASCDSCGTTIESGNTLCERCCDWRGNCFNCGTRIEASEGSWGETVHETDTGQVVCDDCHSTCPGCGVSATAMTYSNEYDDYVCGSCAGPTMVDGTEEWDSYQMSATRLQLPSIAGRENIRTCGVEIEGKYGTDRRSSAALAASFYQIGISSVDTVMSYHHGRGGGFAHVENDSTVDWEAVIGPINMADRHDVQKLNRAVRAIRALVKDGRMKLDLSAGCHIHIDASHVSLGGAFNLNNMWAFMEDVIFRLAAARWPIHRSAHGSDYACPTPKDIPNKRVFGQRFENQRYYALSFSNYFRQMFERCSCGAVRYDDWANCTCDLGKCTFEFRVFNTTANTRKLHAYLALCQALVAKALTMPEVQTPAEEFPADTFRPDRLKDMSETQQQEAIAAWKERLTWLFTELPLTEAEKQSLRYCVENSELVNVGSDFIETLVPTTDEADEETKSDLQEVLA